MKKIKQITAILMTLVLAFTLIACGKSEPKTESPNNSAGTSGGNVQPGDADWVSYAIGSTGLGRFLAGINPAESLTACDAVFDTTFLANPATKEIYSLILKNWYWEDDVTLICEMRDDVYFSNGDNATAEDFIYSYWSHIERGSNYLNEFDIIWDKTFARDKYTAQFVLEAPYPRFIKATIYLIDKSWSEEVGYDSMEWYQPVGSGPYYVEEYTPDSRIVLRSRGDDYWYKDEGKIYVDEWIIKNYPDDSTLYMALEIGDIDIAEVSSVNYSRFITSGGDGFDVAMNLDGTTFYFTFSLHPEDGADYWWDKRLREAVAIGINWDEIGQLTMGDMYVKAYSTASSSSPDFINPGQYEYNPERAKQLLAEAGYGPDNPLHISTTTMDSPMFRNAFEAFLYQASLIGIDANVDFKDLSAALGDWLNPGNTDYGFFYNETGSTTSEVRAAIYDCWDYYGCTYTYLPFPELIEEFQILLRSTDPAEVSAAGKWLQQFIYDEILYIPICELSTAVGWRTSSFTKDQVLGIRPHGSSYQISRLGMASHWK